uniref:Cucumisin n=1 Tax=Cajanus cajan TaxID=3821 RepID=A0A151R8U3_CAJCA|nr:Cucumisin [Cajanus cajan]
MLSFYLGNLYSEAVNLGLEYDASEIDYVKFLCGQGYDTKKLQTLTNDNNSCRQENNGMVRDLNLSSFSTWFTHVFRRTVANVGSATSKYKARVTTPPSLLNIKVRRARCFIYLFCGCYL